MATWYFHILKISLLLYQSSSFEQVLDSVMTLTWSISNDEIEIGVYCKVTLGYCAFGLSNSMTNTDMIVFSTDGSIVSISDNYSYRHETPSTDLDLGGTDDLKYVSGGLDLLNHINITISRKLNTEDQYDQVITPDIESEICWSYKDGSVGLTKHSDKNSATFTWAVLTETNDLENINFNSRELYHGIYLSISWLLLAPIGIISARYFNHTAWWIYVHISTLITASILTIYAVTDLYNLDKRIYNELSENRFFHSRIGMMITSIVISQVFFGILTSYFKIFTKNLHAVTISTRFHRVIGFALLIAGVGVCYKGWIIHGGHGLTIFIVGFILLCLVMVFSESWQVFYKNRFKGRSEKLRK